MKRPLHELHALSEEHQCPILVAGDIFDRWDSSAELINFALENLPGDIYSIPGQHDLPHHNLDDIKRSAYWTLVQAGKIHHLRAGPGHNIAGRIHIHAFPWGWPLRSLPETHQNEKLINIALIHRYVWWKKASYPNAPKEANIVSSNNQVLLNGYTVAVFGDNHKGFWLMAEEHEDPWIINCGALIRRKIDEVSYEPQVGLIHKSGKITIHKLDCSEDKFIDPDEALQVVEHAIEAADLLEELVKTGRKIADFAEAVARFCDRNNVGAGVRKLLTESMEKE